MVGHSLDNSDKGGVTQMCANFDKSVISVKRQLQRMKLSRNIFPRKSFLQKMLQERIHLPRESQNQVDTDWSYRSLCPFSAAVIFLVSYTY
jgi:hypothetical protein